VGTVERLTGRSFMTARDERMHRKLDRERPDTMLTSNWFLSRSYSGAIGAASGSMLAGGGCICGIG
jgi:hypothetical protein